LEKKDWDETEEGLNRRVFLGMSLTAVPAVRFATATARAAGTAAKTAHPAAPVHSPAPTTFNVNLNVNYNWAFGPPAGGPPPIGIFVNGAGAAPEMRTFDVPPRFRVGVFLFANNLTNHANYTGYSGVLTSPFFGQPTSVSNTRRVEAGLNFGF